MSQWRLEGAGSLDLAVPAPDIDVAIDDGRLVAIGGLEQLVAVKRTPGFHLILLQPDHPLTSRVARPEPSAS